MNKQTIEINGDFIKLDQLMKLSGLAESGGHAKELIQYGDVTINGVVCTMRGKKLVSGDVVNYKDEAVEVK